MYIYARRNKLNYLIWLDIVAPALALGQAIGPLGVIMSTRSYLGAQQICHGRSTSIPSFRLPGYQDV